MIGPLDRSDCRKDADALVDLVDPRTTGAPSTAAMDHLEWCRPCGEELQELALAIVAMRRLGDEAGARTDAGHAWSRVSARILRTRAAAAAVAWRWRMSLAGLATGMFLVAAIVGPLALDVPMAGGRSEPTGLTPTQREAWARQLEARYIWETNTVPVGVRSSTARASGPAPEPRYPRLHTLGRPLSTP